MHYSASEVARDAKATVPFRIERDAQKILDYRAGWSNVSARSHGECDELVLFQFHVEVDRQT